MDNSIRHILIIKQQSVLLNDKDVMRLAVFPEYETDIDMVLPLTV